MVLPASCPLIARMGSSSPPTLNWNEQYRKWMDRGALYLESSFWQDKFVQHKTTARPPFCCHDAGQDKVKLKLVVLSNQEQPWIYRWAESSMCVWKEEK